MRNILDGYKIFTLNPQKLRSRDFFKNMLEYRAYVMDKFKQAVKKPDQFTCPLCAATAGKEFLTYAEYTLMECKTCKLVSPNIDFKMLEEEVYDDPAYIKDTTREIIDTFDYRKNTYAPERLSYFLEKVKDVSKEDINLLDVGCGPGYFLSYLKDQGIKNRGLELAEFLVRIGKDRGLNVDAADLEKEPDNTYTVITLFDVIEHIPNPVEFCQMLNKKLKPGGYVMMYTPHIHSVAYYLMGAKQNTLLPYQHLVFLDKDSTKFLAKKSGFTVHSHDFFGLDVMDYFYMKEYEDNQTYLEKLLDFIPVMQAIIDKQNLSNHQRIIFKKVS